MRALKRGCAAGNAGETFIGIGFAEKNAIILLPSGRRCPEGAEEGLNLDEKDTMIALELLNVRDVSARLITELLAVLELLKVMVPPRALALM